MYGTDDRDRVARGDVSEVGNRVHHGEREVVPGLDRRREGGFARSRAPFVSVTGVGLIGRRRRSTGLLSRW